MLYHNTVEIKESWDVAWDMLCQTNFDDVIVLVCRKGRLNTT